MGIEILLLFANFIGGLVIAVLSTMAGIGGGAFMIPYFYFIGLPINEVIGTSKFVIVFISLFGTINYLRLRKVMIKQGIMILIGMIPASYLGAYLVSVINDWILRLIISIFILFYSIRLIYGFLRKKLERIKTSTSQQYVGNNYMVNKPFIAVLIGLLSGFVAGLTGTGGGVVNMPLFLSVMKIPVHFAVALSTFVIFPSSISAAIRHALNNDINYFIGLPFVLGAVIGANIGPRIAIKTRSQHLRLIIGSILFYAGIRMLSTTIF
ncbi:sulfite exporter TauE/SafE family protein [Staphylothermus hellenicus]|uniref:Probable membrane transporter protein n=1 Tax=Staphylothermus hellenicus (strain DSM 12710 / JCM 10830 / BK20S6-10-b1 / P8) TaxID=591019 RepID=D7D9A4_STAHD|nr:sulfite exporter TauE/SafE family protein [Staphylothermus hellenicus]ADI32350.1 protein of unknown function DUF81 [Staphylothermus hellenicus DSM 12710]